MPRLYTFTATEISWWRSRSLTSTEYRVWGASALVRRDHRHHISAAQMAAGHWIRAGDKTVTWNSCHCPSLFSFSSSYNSLFFHPPASTFLLLPLSQPPVFSYDTVFRRINRCIVHSQATSVWEIVSHTHPIYSRGAFYLYNSARILQVYVWWMRACLSLEMIVNRGLKSLSISIYISISIAPPSARFPQLGQCPPKGPKQGIAVPLCVCLWIYVCVCIYTVQEQDL